MSRNAPVITSESRSWTVLGTVRGLLCLLLCASAALLLESRAADSASTNRILLVEASGAVRAFRAEVDVVRRMMDRGIQEFTGARSVAAAWQQFVSPTDVVGIKVYALPGPNSGTRPAVVGSVIEGLVAAGIPSTNIVIWDNDITDLRLSGFGDLARRHEVRLAGSVQTGYDEKAFYESPLLGNLVWGDHEFGRQKTGRKSFVTRLLTKEFTKVINVPPLLNHNAAGVSGCLFSMASGSVDNFFRFEQDPVRVATAVPEIFALPEIYDRVVLHIVDALICQYEGNERALLHYSAVLNQVRFSRDPVALDVLSLQDLNRQRGGPHPSAKATRDLYDNAALLELGTSEVKNVRVDSVKL